MRISVTAGDIHEGQRCDCTGCPVALAMRRATGRVWWVGISGAENVCGRRVEFSHRVSQWVVDFDGRYQVAPFEFDAEVPDA